MMIRFPCQKVVTLEEFTYFQKTRTIHSFQESCAPILFFKNLKNSHLSWISNFHALNEKDDVHEFLKFKIRSLRDVLFFSRVGSGRARDFKFYFKVRK